MVILTLCCPQRHLKLKRVRWSFKSLTLQASAVFRTRSTSSCWGGRGRARSLQVCVRILTAEFCETEPKLRSEKSCSEEGH